MDGDISATRHEDGRHGDDNIIAALHHQQYWLLVGDALLHDPITERSRPADQLGIGHRTARSIEGQGVRVL